MEKVLNNTKKRILGMDIKQVIMSSGNQYYLIWDLSKCQGTFYEMIDLEKGWVTINASHISRMYHIGSLSKKGIKAIKELFAQ